jgi:hypothetical protein
MAADCFTHGIPNLTRRFHFEGERLDQGMILLEGSKPQLVVESDVRNGSRSILTPQAHAFLAFVSHTVTQSFQE